MTFYPTKKWFYSSIYNSYKLNLVKISTATQYRLISLNKKQWFDHYKRYWYYLYTSFILHFDKQCQLLRFTNHGCLSWHNYAYRKYICNKNVTDNLIYFPLDSTLSNILSPKNSAYSKKLDNSLILVLTELIFGKTLYFSIFEQFEWSFKNTLFLSK